MGKESRVSIPPNPPPPRNNDIHRLSLPFESEGIIAGACNPFKIIPSVCVSSNPYKSM